MVHLDLSFSHILCLLRRGYACAAQKQLRSGFETMVLQKNRHARMSDGSFGICNLQLTVTTCCCKRENNLILNFTFLLL